MQQWAVTFVGDGVMGEDVPALKWSCSSYQGCDYKSFPVSLFTVRTRQDGVCENRQRRDRVYDARIHEQTKTTTTFSCDLRDMTMRSDNDLNPLSGPTRGGEGPTSREFHASRGPHRT